MTGQLTFTDPKVQLCPFPAYDSLREENPVYQDPVTGHYVLTRYDDIRNALLNHEALSNHTGLLGNRWTEEANRLFEEKGWHPLNLLVSDDPPEHTKFRALVDKVFTNPRVATLEPRIEEIIDELIDAFPENGEIDFLDAFAVSLPMRVIAEQLGVSPADQDRFKHWSDAITETTSPTLTPKRQMEVAHIVIDMQQYMAKEIERVRANPNDLLLSHLANVKLDEGRRLTMTELQALLLQILVAGNETTTTTLASGMKALIEEPQLADDLYAYPDRVRTFCEETLRTATPLQTLFRRAKTDVAVSGVVIPADAIVEVRFGAGNRDPGQFKCPAQIDLGRTNAQNHLAFGAGIHVCVGNRLARAELRLAFHALTQRLTNFRYSRGERSQVPMEGYTPYGLHALWMNFDRR